ncbi:TetR family transcriptional regulator [Salsuginibacillus halophilus]|uniref:TetR family transcriptional regulator n=1 Tax=Salsuginibacillus halophilus TaxID=517424 RepID=A0A2P8HHX9_9BACI|nr:TetR/AcrR family transcriptional regulator [Salsuginibacillus halophilus]PSL45826.1 TetR family transcriptional regulator [Salsuginibacillus halophilus]
MEKKRVPSLVKDEALVHKRRAQMVKGAVALFKEKGFHRTTTREIAKASGFSIGTLYEYIGSKEDVLYLVCDAVYGEVMERLEQLLTEENAGVERVRHLVRSLFKVIDEMQDEVLVMYQEAKSLPKEALPYVLQREKEMTERIQDVLAKSRAEGVIQLPDEQLPLAAENLMVKGHMWAFRRWSLASSYSLETYTKAQIEQILSGLKADVENKRGR